MMLVRFVIWTFLLFWLLYEGRRFVFEHDACHLEYIDNIEYLRQTTCSDPKMRAQWEGKRVHCGAAEAANAEPRLNCAYRRWWENSGWFVLVQRFTGNSLIMVVVVCSVIFSMAWLLSRPTGNSVRRKRLPPAAAAYQHRYYVMPPNLQIEEQPQQQQQQQTKIVYLQAAPRPMMEDDQEEYDNDDI